MNLIDSRAKRRTRRESGQAGGEILFFSAILITAMLLVIVNAWATINAKFMVTAAAREASRAYVESISETDATANAESAAASVYGSYRANTARTKPIEITGEFGRCERITISARYQMPAMTIPFFSISFGSRTVSSAHSEIVDPYRSGLENEVGGDCLDF